jgi:hypothetical protein
MTIQVLGGGKKLGPLAHAGGGFTAQRIGGIDRRFGIFSGQFFLARRSFWSHCFKRFKKLRKVFIVSFFEVEISP